MDQVAVDVQQCGAVFFTADDVGFPEFVVERLDHIHEAGCGVRN
jgi:hypothetical protein